MQGGCRRVEHGCMRLQRAHTGCRGRAGRTGAGRCASTCSSAALQRALGALPAGSCPCTACGGPPPCMTGSQSRASSTLTNSACGGHTGRQLLAALEAGAPMRKKWVTRLSASEAAAAPRTTRHIRCRVEGGRVTLRYHHQARLRLRARPRAGCAARFTVARASRRGRRSVAPPLRAVLCSGARAVTARSAAWQICLHLFHAHFCVHGATPWSGGCDVSTQYMPASPCLAPARPGSCTG